MCFKFLRISHTGKTSAVKGVVIFFCIQRTLGLWLEPGVNGCIVLCTNYSNIWIFQHLFGYIFCYKSIQIFVCRVFSTRIHFSRNIYLEIHSYRKSQKCHTLSQNTIGMKENKVLYEMHFKLLGSTKPCLFWSMDIESKMCVLKQNNTLTPDGTGFISGNRACGLLGNRIKNICFFLCRKNS